ncbi:MAG: GTP 3',8-cyclase MoaA [Planctomycetota bacterium]|nr:GTP 3',8-cyclase MoaA [Planctomycetota bacterium]
MSVDAYQRPLRDLRISVTDRCNFRCPYCMPAEVFGESYEFLPKREILTFEELERLARLFVGHGVKKLRITGGEPLLRKGLPQLVSMLARIDGVQDLSLTTNGRLLADSAAELKEAGLHRLTVSVDSLDEEVFQRLNGRDEGPARVLQGIEAAERAGFAGIKINCVVQRGVNDHTVLDLARHFKGTGHIVRFIEYMDVGNLNGWDLSQVVPAADLVAQIDEHFPLERVDPNYGGEVATRYRYTDGSGEIGMIASVSQPVCGGCTRARLSPTGSLVTCLFAAGGTDLRGPLRDGATDAEVSDLIGKVWTARTDRYSEERAENTSYGERPPKIEMFRIGG